MSYKHTLDATIESLHEIENLVRGFPENGKIPVIEMDLTLQKVRNVYELLLMFKREEGTAMVERAVSIPSVNQEPVIAAPSDSITKPQEVEGSSALPEKQVSATVTDKSAGSQTLADQFKGRTTLHESLHQTFNREADTLAKAKPVTNLRTAIGINDRFTFIRELFGNDAKAFEQTITILNDAANFNDAYNYMIQHFDWDMDSEPVQQLLDMIRRKFIKGRHE
jgi:hypothetical protein